MKKILLFTLSFIFLSCASKKLNKENIDYNDNYEIKLKNADIAMNIFGCNCIDFGKTKEESITLYQIQLSVIIEGIKKNGILDFNNFSLVDVKNKLRHRPENAHCNTAFTSYSIERVKLEDFKYQDNFIKYSIPEFTNYDHYQLQRNRAGFLNGESAKTRFGINTVESFEKRIIKNKVFKLDFYTNIKEEGEFILYYKDKIVKKFSASKKMKKFE